MTRQLRYPAIKALVRPVGGVAGVIDSITLVAVASAPIIPAWMRTCPDLPMGASAYPASDQQVQGGENGHQNLSALFDKMRTLH